VKTIACRWRKEDFRVLKELKEMQEMTKGTILENTSVIESFLYLLLLF